MLQLPALLRPAADFQKLLLEIRDGSDENLWRTRIDRAAQNAGGDSVTVALRELARCWEARLAEQEIDHALRKFYRVNVRFPERFDDVKADILESLRVDPWGEAWIYRTTAPEGFSDQQGQRYEIGPTRYPHLSNFQTAVKAQPAPRDWKIAVRDVPGAKALEIRTANGQVAIVQPGTRIQDVTLAYIGDGWALFADTEGLFTVEF